VVFQKENSGLPERKKFLVFQKENSGLPDRKKFLVFQKEISGLPERNFWSSRKKFLVPCCLAVPRLVLPLYLVSPL
jgi:hypothetical protein